ncbi:hypothetical protein BV25DRAFT_1911641 [Artomyces pyxidatus]|uniref:Uncharacterized protein n=1 Tax=Artomyces pyxidatus TaxID=48021 RepID=A0ACB8TH90_9AGAM|nr:hypothetical protein BV25DRAFT_1911641 [Artomyces pyxidatus]
MLQLLHSLSSRIPFPRGLHSIPRSRITSRLKPLVWGSAFAIPTALALQSAIYLDSDTQKDGSDVVADPATSIEFPTTLHIPAKVPTPSYTLIGVGVRTVSFLKIKVYSVGFYADLSNPNLTISRSASPEDKIAHIIGNTSCMLRIIPTRNTSYTHLRDAFVRTLQARQQLGHKLGSLSQEELVSAQAPISKLKTLFPNAPFLKHTPLDIILSPPDSSQPRTLIFRDLGVIQHDWVAHELMSAYFDGEGNSPPLKKMVMQKLEAFGTS